jgi:hypothetical protein
MNCENNITAKEKPRPRDTHVSHTFAQTSPQYQVSSNRLYREILHDVQWHCRLIYEPAVYNEKPPDSYMSRAVANVLRRNRNQMFFMCLYCMVLQRFKLL